MHSFEAGSRQIERRRVKLTIGNLNNSKSISIEAVESPQISAAILGFPSEDIITIAEEKGIQLADVYPNARRDSEEEIGLLVGEDFYWKVVTSNMEKIQDSLMATETLFGWCLLGPASNMRYRSNNGGVYNVCVFNSVIGEEEESSISKGLRAFWDLDSLGIVEKSSEETVKEEFIMKDFESKIKYDGHRYAVGLPWKNDVILTNNNRAVAERRFEHQLKKFRKDPKLFKDYSEVVETYLDSGIAEIACGNGLPGRTFYLPHREVIKQDRVTTRTRIVFDASSHAKGSPSLNDCLHSGSTLNVDLLGLLFKFRKFKVVFTADIEKAFLHVALSKEDRDVTRFFWIRDGNMESANPEKVVLRMTRVIFGINASPYLLAATIGYHLEKYKEMFPEAYELLKNSLYVDDLLGGAQDEKEALRLASEGIDILQDAGMPLRKFQSNSYWLRNQLGENNESKILKPEGVSLKVLGLAWQPENDIFRFDVTSLLEFLQCRKNTKRFILQASSRIFDPIGFVTPFTIRIKCLFQEIWQRGTKWDEAIPEDLKERWEKWCSELCYLEGVKIPRFYGTMQEDKLQLHCFTDASEKAYGATIYIRIENSKGEITVNLVVAKSRVAPLKKLTIPRLELMGAVVGTKLMTTVRSYFVKENPTLHFWSDSTITISWIKGATKQWKPFISNRTSEIQNAYDPALCRHIPGIINPADILTRGLSVIDLISSDLWWKGPEFLRKSEREWPEQPKTILVDEDKIHTQAERRPRSKDEVLTALNIKIPHTEALLKLTDYSKYARVIRIIAWVKRYVSNLKLKRENRHKGALSTEEILEGEMYWIRRTQTESFQDEIIAVKNNVAIAQGSKISDLKAFIDQEDILRLGGRLQFSDLEYDEKHPILLPENHAFTHLLIMKHHLQLKHMGVSATLASLRSKFWIARGRQIIKNVLSKCQKCRILKSKPFEHDTAPLPPERVTASIAFQATGVDFAGPVIIKHYNDETKSWNQSKSYIALFTWSTTRAVHLELVSSLSAEHFILALKRFIGRRGVSHIFLSDNAKTFKRTDKEISRLWDSVVTDDLKEFFGEKRIQWRFIVDRAPWWSGMWERMVRTMKDCIKRTLGRALLTYEEMETVVIEVESVMNSRPITYISSDQDEPSPLTPSHFLIGKRQDSLPSRKFKMTEIQSTRDNLTKRWKYRQELLNRFGFDGEANIYLNSEQRRRSSEPKTIKLRLKLMTLSLLRMIDYLDTYGRLVEL